ncbi:MAG: GspMb/PilO family protein [Candidatus Rifleibacteriota bacterium]
MQKPEKAILLLILSWLGTIFLILAIIILLPSFLSERENLIRLRNSIADRHAIETKMKSFLDSFRSESDQIKTEISRREKIITEKAFKCRTEDQIPEFINELQQIFSDTGTSIINLGYQKRNDVGNFLVLPFSAEFKASYESLRKLLHKLETNSAGISIDNLNFISFNDEDHLVRLKADCSLRFRKIGK